MLPELNQTSCNAVLVRRGAILVRRPVLVRVPDPVGASHQGHCRSKEDMKITSEIHALVTGMKYLASGKVTCPCCGEPTAAFAITMFGRNFTVSLDLDEGEDEDDQEDTPTPLLDALNKNTLVQ
jgi:hypothetical protein